MNSVSLDAISDDSSDAGTLQAFSASNVLLDTFNTGSLSTNQVSTMTVSSGTAIAYVVALAGDETEP